MMREPMRREGDIPDPGGTRWGASAGFLRFLVSGNERRFATALALLLGGGLTEGISILLVIPLLGLVGGSGTANFELPFLADTTVSVSLTALLAAMVCLVTLHAVFMRYKNIFLAEFLFSILNKLRLDLFGTISRLRWDAFTSKRHADLQHLLTSDVERVYTAAMAVMVTLQTVILMAVYLFVASFISPLMTVLSAALGATLILLLAPLRRRATLFGIERTSNKRHQFRTVTEFLSGLKTAKIHGAEERYQKRLATNLDLVQQEAVGYMKIVSLGTIVSQAISAVAVVGLVYAGIVIFQLPLPELIALLLILVRISPRFLGLQSNLQDVLSNITVYETVKEFKASCDAQAEQQTALRPGAPMTLSESIEFDEVSYSYPGRRSSPVLESVSLRIPAKKVTALIGPSGGGKSTVADLVAGLLRPRQGRILIDGQDLDESDAIRWRSEVAYVPQTPFLLQDGIAANLRLAAPDADEDAIWAALEKANAADFVREMPGQLDAVIGENGVALSGGQRQRIVLARALMIRPQLLILDEATSALDWESQDLIGRSIDALRGQITVLTIAHRASLVTQADHVIALSNGAVLQSGTVEQLVDTEGPLASMVRADSTGLDRPPGRTGTML